MKQSVKKIPAVQSQATGPPLTVASGTVYSEAFSRMVRIW